MHFPFYIARKYIKSKSSTSAINYINRIASGSIIVAGAALFVVLSVFSGLKTFTLSFTSAIDPELKATAAVGKSFVWDELAVQKIENSGFFQAHTRVIEERVLFSYNEKQIFAYVKGVDTVYTQVNPVDESLFQGQWLEHNTGQAVVGYTNAHRLSLGVFSHDEGLQVYAPKPGKGQVDRPEDALIKDLLYPVGIYAISEDIDQKYVFVDLALAQSLMQWSPTQISAVEFKLNPGVKPEAAVEFLTAQFPELKIRTREQLNESLYRMLNTENIAVYLIFTLVLIVALFSLAGSLIMMIIDKKGNLQTLFNMGANLDQLRQVFWLQGFLISIVGGLLGIVLGIGIVLIQEQFGLIMITQTMAYPVEFLWENVAIVMGTIVLLGGLASRIASSRINEKLLRSN